MLHSFHNKLDAYKEYNLFYLLDIVLGKKMLFNVENSFYELKDTRQGKRKIYFTTRILRSAQFSMSLFVCCFTQVLWLFIGVVVDFQSKMINTIKF